MPSPSSFLGSNTFLDALQEESHILWLKLPGTDVADDLYLKEEKRFHLSSESFLCGSSSQFSAIQCILLFFQSSLL